MSFLPVTPSPQAQAYARFIQAYQHNRGKFVSVVLGITPEPWQGDALASLDNGILRLAIKSGHGVGKSAFLSWVIIHFMVTRFPQKTVVTAPTQGQLFDALAAEVRHWISKLPPFIQELLTIKAERIELQSAPAQSFIAYRTSRQEQPEALQGVHADNVLLVGDEASGIHDRIYQAAGGSLSTKGSIFILTGNPTKAEGYFYTLFKNPLPNWDLYTVSCRDSSRVDPDYITQVKAQYGEDSNVYRVRCLGEFPTSDDEKLIPFHLIESAIERDIRAAPDTPAVWGLDVARSGKDKTALLCRRNRIVEWVHTLNTSNLMEVVGWVKKTYDDTSAFDRPSEICVDSIGLGAGVFDRLVELNYPAIGVNVAEVAALDLQASKLRDDLWLQVRDWFTRQDCRIPNDPSLIRDLQAPSFKFTSGGKYKIASKDEMKRAGYSSPDRGDALALTFAVMPSKAVYGSDGPSSVWNRELDHSSVQPMVI